MKETKRYEFKHNTFLSSSFLFRFSLCSFRFSFFITSFLFFVYFSCILMSWADKWGKQGECKRKWLRRVDVCPTCFAYVLAYKHTCIHLTSAHLVLVSSPWHTICLANHGQCFDYVSMILFFVVKSRLEGTSI